jgi:hypothetical protein
MTVAHTNKVKKATKKAEIKNSILRSHSSTPAAVDDEDARHSPPVIELSVDTVGEDPICIRSIPLLFDLFARRDIPLPCNSVRGLATDPSVETIVVHSVVGSGSCNLKNDEWVRIWNITYDTYTASEISAAARENPATCKADDSPPEYKTSGDARHAEKNTNNIE